MVPIKTTYKCRKTGKMIATTVTQDGGIRPGTNMKKLARLRTPFKKKGGTTTAGNCSQITDGCAVVFLARRDWA